jgi:hypothetical protein
LTRFLAIVVVAAAFAAPAGAGNTDFPEQPGTNVARACAAITTNPGAFPVATQHSSPTAQANVLPRLADACTG